ncbi:hypothetical protein Z043_114785 [Scleropages formosus]|uniref:Vasohibin-2-like n=1 Tax=Scleropages formosus TaxID=113540 RepID=A0A0P7WY00_SCLFO|nr:hypothetical protein Z043_114785 [Scleropages formosus]
MLLLFQPPTPAVPTYRPSMTVPDWLQAIQNYMKTLQYPLSAHQAGQACAASDRWPYKGLWRSPPLTTGRYNHTGTQFFEIRKTRPLSGDPSKRAWLNVSESFLRFLPRLMETAREMTRESLPIKCLEAVILGMYPCSETLASCCCPLLSHSRGKFIVPSGVLSPGSAGPAAPAAPGAAEGNKLPLRALDLNRNCSYLTNGLASVERFPISFKTQFSGHHFHHVVLGVYCNGRYGTLGMSRRADLMGKALTFRTLSDLIFDFEESYRRYQHVLKKVKIGLYVPHDPHVFQPIEWKHLVLNACRLAREDMRKELEKHARDMRMKVGCVGITGTLTLL